MDVDLGAGQQLSLRSVDPGGLGAGARVDSLVALQRLRSWADAQEQVLLAAMVEPGDPPRVGVPRRLASARATAEKQFVREEIACALRISPLTVNARLHVARELTQRLPGTLALLDAGVITLRAARFLAESVGALSGAAVAEVERRVLPRAGEQTFANFRACVQRAVIAVDPRAAEERHDAAVLERRVEYRALEDGLGSLYAVLPADDLQAVLEAVQACADALPAQDYPAGPRAADQRRADALVTLSTGCTATATIGTAAATSTTGTGVGTDCTTGAAAWADGDVAPGCGFDADAVLVRPVAKRHGRRPGVQVTVALSTLLGLDEQCGELAGYGPIPAGLARRIAADATGTWRRLVTDAFGRLLDYGRTVYRPPQDLTDHVLARDRTCRFPGCRRQAVRCDIDHQTAWEDGGPTDPGNLECLCARHHALKHEAGWTVTGDPAGVLTWTTPTGHIYLDPPGEHPIDHTRAAAEVVEVADAADDEHDTGRAA